MNNTNQIDIQIKKKISESIDELADKMVNLYFEFVDQNGIKSPTFIELYDSKGNRISHLDGRHEFRKTLANSIEATLSERLVKKKTEQLLAKLELL